MNAAEWCSPKKLKEDRPCRKQSSSCCGFARPSRAKGYLLVVETPSRDEHNAFDQDPRFVRFLKKAQKWQPEEPWVMLGDTFHRV